MTKKTPPKKRIAISCSPALYESLVRLSKASGSPIVGFPTELLESNVVLFNRLADVLEASKERNIEPNDFINMIGDDFLENTQIKVTLNEQEKDSPDD